MFARLSIALLALPLLIAASAVPRGEAPIPASQCNTGSLKCCNNVGTSQQLLANNAIASNSLLAVPLSLIADVTAVLGVGCSPLSIVGIAGNSCSAQPVCCTNNQFNGLVNVGCTPVNVNL